MIRQFDAALTLMDSAQVFHWVRTDTGFAALVDGRIMTAEDEGPQAKHYFDDARDYRAIAEKCAFVPAKEAMRLCPGLRVLNQPAWEALVAFILSANNNVPRIRNLVRVFAEVYGEVRPFHGATLYGFPSPETLARADEGKMRAQTHCGYRAPYLIATARKIVDGFDLEALRNADTEDARRALMTLPGVGGKVADCVLLFGLGHASAFPVDVWVARLMENWFGVHGSREFMRREAVRLLGEQCGMIQQSLFHAARTGKIKL